MMKSVVCPLRIRHSRMQTLADLYTAIADRTSSRGWSAVPTKHREDMLRSITRIAEMCNLDPSLIDINEIEGTAFDHKFHEFVLNQKIGPDYAARHVRMKPRLLRFAFACGWTSHEMELRRLWDPVLMALKGHGGTSGIVEFAIRLGKTPQTLSQEDIEKWRQDMLERKRSLITVIAGERLFRSVMRRTKLSRLFIRWSVKSKNPRQYALPLEDMSHQLRAELSAIIAWKTEDGGCDYKFRIRAVTARCLLQYITELLGYAACNLGMRQITSLRQIVTRDVIKGFINFKLRRGCSRNGIRASLLGIHGLIKHGCWVFANGEYEWFATLLKEIPKRVSDGRTMTSKAVRYQSLLKMLRTMWAEVKRSTEADPVKLAWEWHDLAFLSFFVLTGWRKRNVISCTYGFRGANIEERDIPRDVMRAMQLPRWARRILQRRRKLFLAHFDENSTKAKTEVWVLLAEQCVNILRGYLKHRPLLVGRRDVPTLFISRALKPISTNHATDFVARLTVKHLGGTRFTPRMIRHAFAAHAVTHEKLATAQKKLFHKRLTTTWIYTDGCSASRGVVVLEKHRKTRRLVPKHNQPRRRGVQTTPAKHPWS